MSTRAGQWDVRAAVRLPLHDVLTGCTSPDAIAMKEEKQLKSVSRSSAFCHVLSVYRLLDLIASLEPTASAAPPRPNHPKMQVDLSHFGVRIVHLGRDGTALTISIFSSEHQSKTGP